MAIQLIETEEQFNAFKSENKRFFLLKHSLTCPISGEAKSEFELFSKDAVIPLGMLYIQEARQLSNQIAETYQVKHESPQALLFEDEIVKWHASHWNVTKTNLNKAIK